MSLSHKSALLVALGLCLCSPSFAEKVYVYANKDGSRLISNTPANKPELTLIKVYEPVATVRSWPESKVASRALTPTQSSYDPIIQQVADRHNQDRSLIKAIVHVESSFNTRAVSPKGALGLMQLMPGTASRYELDDPFDAQANINAGTQYFSQLMQRYNNDVRKSLAAYNAGETAVDQYAGIPPYPETQAYVKSVLDLHRKYQDQSVQTLRPASKPYSS